MTKQSTKWATPFLALAAVFAAGCGQNKTEAPAAGGSKVVLRIAYQPNVSHAVPLVGFAPDKNIYATRIPEIDFQTKTFSAGPEMMEALKAGALDVALFGPPPILNTWAKTKDFVIIANTATGGSVLVARPGSGIKTAKDLAVKKVAIAQTGNVQDVMLRAVLVQNGLNSTDKGGTVSVLVVKPADVLSRMQAGDLDAALMPEPWGSRLEKEAKATVVLEYDKLPQGATYPQTMYVASRKWVDAHPAEAKKLVQVTDDLTNEIAKDPNAYADTISSEIKRVSGKPVPVDLVKASFKRLKFTTRVTDADLASFADLLVQVGYQKTKPDTTGIVYAPK